MTDKAKPKPVRKKRRAVYKKCQSCDKDTKTSLMKCKCGGKLLRIIVKKVKPYIVCDDWQTLQTGQIIKVKYGVGPHSYSEETEKRYNFASDGLFEVYRVLEEGVLGVAIGTVTAGYEFIYMGEPREGKYGVKLEPHKIYIQNPELKGKI